MLNEMVYEDSKPILYCSWEAAVQKAVVDTIEDETNCVDAWAEYDIDKIADDVLANYGDGFFCEVDREDFWDSVGGHRINPATREDAIRRFIVDVVKDEYPKHTLDEDDVNFIADRVLSHKWNGWYLFPNRERFWDTVDKRIPDFAI